MDFIASLLNSPVLPYALGALVLFVLYQQLAPRLKLKVGSGPGLEGLLSILLGPRFAAAQLDRAVARQKKVGNFLEAGRMLEEAGDLARAADVLVEGGEHFAAATVLERQGKAEKAGELYLQAGDYKKAAQVFVDAGKPGRAAQLFLEKGNTLEAARLFGLAQQFDRAAELYVKAGYPLRAAESWAKQGEFKRAAECYEKHFDDNVTYATTYSATAQSADHKSALQAGRLYEKAGDLQKAYQAYTKGSYFKEAAAALLALGQPARAAELFMRAEDPESAARAYEQAGDGVKAALLRGEVALKADRRAEAAGFFQRGQDYLRSADLFEAEGLLSEAAGAYEAGESWIAAGGVYIRAGLKDKAAAAYERGGDWETAGKLFDEIGNGRKAMEMFARAGLSFKSGEAAFKAGDKERAIAQLQRVSPGDESYRTATELLAQLFIERGEAALAVERVQKTLGDEPISAHNLDLYYWLGLAHEAAGHGGEALRVFKKIQAEDLGFRDVAQRSARLSAVLGAAQGATPVPQPAPPGPAATPTSAAAPPPAAPRPTAPPAPAGVPTPGPRPRFALHEELGHGPLGALHRGEDLIESKNVVLRLLAPELLSSPGALAALTSDLKAGAQVAHPALPRTLGFVDLGGRRAVVGEWVAGRNFGEALAGGRLLPGSQVLSLGKALFHALAAIHARGQAHGSLQPSNVMVSQGQVRLADFGFGRLRQRHPGSHRAPEGGLTAAADVYAAAAVLYHLVSGQNPAGPAAPPALQGRVAGVPAPLERALLRCLAPEAAQRPTAEQALAELGAPA